MRAPRNTSLSVMRSLDAPGQISISELSTCLETLTSCMDLPFTPLPPILVLHVSRAVAERFGVGSPGIIRHNRESAKEPRSYYEIWIVGRPSIESCVGAIIGVLEDHFLLTLSFDDRQRALESAMWVLACSTSECRAIQ